MEIQKNSRQIPSNKKYTANKKYSDLVYGYLQEKSVLDESLGVRYLPKKEVKYTQMAEDLGLSRQTASRRFNNLIEQDLVYYDEDNIIYDILLNDTIEKTIDNENMKNAIKMFVDDAKVKDITKSCNVGRTNFYNKLNNFKNIIREEVEMNEIYV